MTKQEKIDKIKQYQDSLKKFQDNRKKAFDILVAEYNKDTKGGVDALQREIDSLSAQIK